MPEIKLKHILQESLFHLSVHRISMFLQHFRLPQKLKQKGQNYREQ